MKDIDRMLSTYEAQRKAVELANDAIVKAGGMARRHVVERPCYFVAGMARFDGVPAGALFCKMPACIAARLEAKGLFAPVSFKSLPGKYWWVRMDAAAENDNFEPGGITVKRIVSTEELAGVLVGYYAEVLSGPFDSREDGPAIYDLEGERDKG